MKFPIISHLKNKIRLKNLITFSFILIIIEALVFYPEDENNLKIIILFGIPFFVWIFAMIYLNYVYKTFKVIGFLEYKNNMVIIKDVFINKEDIKAIIIKYNNYFGISVRFAVSQGDNNEVFILTKDGKQYKFDIYLKNKEMFILLKQFISEIANLGIKIHFYKGNKKIFPKPRSRKS